MDLIEGFFVGNGVTPARHRTCGLKSIGAAILVMSSSLLVNPRTHSMGGSCANGKQYVGVAWDVLECVDM